MVSNGFDGEMTFAKANKPDQIWLPPMVVSSEKHKQASVYRNDPTMSITGWGYHYEDTAHSKNTAKPFIRSYVAIATSAKYVPGLDEATLIEDWDALNVLLKDAQRAVWDYTEDDTMALAVVNCDDKKVNLIPSYCTQKERGEHSLSFSGWMFKNSKYTNVIQEPEGDVTGANIYKLTAPIQIYLDRELQGSCQTHSTTNEAARGCSEKMKYNCVKISYNNAVRFARATTFVM